MSVKISKHNFRIAILSDRCPPLNGGGIANAHYNLFRILREKGFDARIFTYLDEMDRVPGHKAEKNIYRYGANRFDRSIIRLSDSLKHKFSKRIFRKKPDVGLAYQNGLIRLAAKGIRKLNSRLKDFDPDTVILPDFGAPGYTLKKIKTARHIHIAHNIPLRYLSNPLIGIHSKGDAELAIRKEQKSLTKIDAVICPSNYMKQVFRKTFKFNGDIRVIPNLLDNSLIFAVPKKDIHSLLKTENDIPVIYIPSAGSNIKGERYVVEIIRRLSTLLSGKVAFYLSGSLTEAQKYELGLFPGKFHILAPGTTGYEENMGYVKDCKLCVSPTLLESFGMAMLEAQFCGLPCVAFDVEGVGELITNGVNGFRVPCPDVEQLIQKAMDLLTNNQLYQDMVKSMESFVRDKYASDKIVEDYLTVIENRN